MKQPRIIKEIAELRQIVSAFREAKGGGNPKVGLVPTMGYLHEGHESLIRRSKAENGFTVISIFVNPLQFGPNEDFDRYPRDPERDLAVVAACGADVVFMPEAREMYPRPIRTNVQVKELTDRLCGASRPGHFDGVATVVLKLFHIVQPDHAYFGMKDAQQVAVLTRMAEDLNVPVQIVPCPIVREADGLALSSRNVYLTEEERAQALILNRSLRKVPELIAGGATPETLVASIRDQIATRPLANVDYVEVVAYPDLVPPPSGEPLNRLGAPLLAAVAVYFGKTRLIDNFLYTPAEVK